jgi:hypothetical protein
MADSTEADQPDTPEPPVPEPEGSPEPEAASGPSAGWYPDPNAGGANLMRYWDGAAWTNQVQSGSEVSATHRTADERKVILSQQLQTAAARGLRIESQSDFQAVLVEGKPVNHVLHAILTIFTCLLWGIVWAIIAATGGETRQMVVVDEFGNVLWQNLGKA